MLDNRVYVNTYFRVNAGYVWGVGMDDDACDRFYAEVSTILSGLGFDITPAERHSCPRANRGMESLYCHPQELSGYIAQDSISEIEEALSNANTFKHYKTDTYETAYNYTSDEFRAELDTKRDAIEAAILTRFTTKRRNLYATGNALNAVRANLPIFRHSPLERIEAEYIDNLFNDMTASGKIVTAQKDGMKLYRTRSKHDPKLPTLELHTQEV